MSLTKLRNKPEYGKRKVNGLHRDNPPAWELTKVIPRYKVD